jgi:hypothetical protein
MSWELPVDKESHITNLRCLETSQQIYEVHVFYIVCKCPIMGISQNAYVLRNNGSDFLDSDLNLF